jgi:hypothetical protein
MTALALLNAYNDPHLLIDTLVTADGHIDQELKDRAWIPALGHVSRNYSNENGPFHIVRLGRKTMVLSDGSGIVGYAGDCSVAFKFWCILSERILFNKELGKERVELVDLQACMQQLSPSELRKISFAGTARSSTDSLDIFTHNCQSYVSEMHGVCYLAGSGIDLIIEEIKRHDKYVAENSSVFPTAHGVTATGHLTEVAATSLLHQETSIANGNPGSALSIACGGFYERYCLNSLPVTPLLPVLDMHIDGSHEQLTAHRVYFAEMMFSNAHAAGFMVQHLSLVNDPTKIGLITSQLLEFEITDAYGALIPNVFVHYDDTSFSKNIDARLTNEIADRLFSKPVKIQRVNLCLQKFSHSVCRSLQRNSDWEPSLATISMRGEKLVLELSTEVVCRIRESLSRMPQE